jgi:hypothetical protein
VIVPPQGFGVLLARRQHRLVSVDVIGDPGHGEVDGEDVVQLAPYLGDRPVPRKATVPDPTEDVPCDAPSGQGDGRFDLGALGLGTPRAARVGAVVELTDEVDRAVEGEDMAMSMVADVHQVTADGAVPVEDIELQEGEIGVLGPVMGHGVDLRVVGDSLPIVLPVA